MRMDISRAPAPGKVLNEHACDIHVKRTYVSDYLRLNAGTGISKK
jgi:hypothetical protein